MRDTFGPSSTPCSPLLKHARHTSKEPEGTREARLSCVWWTKRKRALVPLVTEEGSEGIHQGGTLKFSAQTTPDFDTPWGTGGWDPCRRCRSRDVTARQGARSKLKTGRTVYLHSCDEEVRL